jgi:hypothetical protein
LLPFLRPRPLERPAGGAVDNEQRSLVATPPEGHGSAGRVKSAASWRREQSHAQIVTSSVTIEHGEHLPFEASEHRGTRTASQQTAGFEGEKNKTPPVKTGALYNNRFPVAGKTVATVAALDPAAGPVEPYRAGL